MTSWIKVRRPGSQVDRYPGDHQALIRDGGSLLVRDADGRVAQLYAPNAWLTARLVKTPDTNEVAS